MYLYRPGWSFLSLDKSLKDSKEFNTLKEMYEYVKKNSEIDCSNIELHFMECDFTSFKESYDRRIGWQKTYVIVNKNKTVSFGYFTKDLTKVDCIKAYEKWKRYQVRGEKDVDVYLNCLELVKASKKAKNVEEYQEGNGFMNSDAIGFETASYRYLVVAPNIDNGFVWEFVKGNVNDNLFGSIVNEKERISVELKDIDKIYNRIKKI